MRAIDDPTPAYLDVLRLLRQWGALPESDISRMLRQWMLTINDFREMEEHGYVDLTYFDVFLSGLLDRLAASESQHGWNPNPAAPRWNP